MVKLKKLKLHHLENERLSNSHMRCLVGGSWACTCGCHYASTGGSSSAVNDAANFEGNKFSYGGGFESCGCAGNSGVTLSGFWKPTPTTPAPAL